MKQRIAIFLLSLLATLASAQTEVRLAGFDGDANIVNELLNEVVNPQLVDKGVVAVFDPVPPEFQVNLLNALSAGQAADLFYIDIFWADSIIDTGKVLPIGSLDVLGQASPFIPSLMNAFAKNGDVYGIAKDFNTLAVEYNKDIFDEAGVAYPDETDDFNSFKAKLQQIQSRLRDTYGICVMPDFARFGAFAYATGWQPFDRDGHTHLDADFRRAFEWYTGLVEDGAGITQDIVGSPGWTGGCFATDQVAVAVEGAWIGGFLRDQAPNLEYGTTFIPKDPVSGERGNFLFTVAWAVNRDSSNLEAALDVLNALTSPEAQQWVLERGLAIPSRRQLSDNPYFYREGKESELNRVVFLGASDGNVLPFRFAEYGGEWKSILDEALSAVLLGELDVAEALSEAQRRLDDLTGR